MPSYNPAVGIDLGTSKCCVAVVRDGKVEVIENERGSKTTPSYVAFTDTKRLVGEEAQDQMPFNPANTVFGVKRILGRSWDDPEVKRRLKYLPYEIIDYNGRCCFNVQYKGSARTLSPEQVTAMLLTKMKQVAEQHLGCPVTRAVVSVPGCFTNAQRQATLDAAAIAGVEVLQLVSEPVAAALAYAEAKTGVKETVVVVDFGGGKLEGAVVEVRDGGVRVLEVTGDPHIGGINFDERLLGYFIENCERKFGRDAAQSKKTVAKLRQACEKVKRTLSLLPKDGFRLDSVGGDGEDFVDQITQEQFNDLNCKLLYKSSCATLEYLLRSINNKSLQGVTKVVLVGGSTRVPVVQEIIRNVFAGMTLDRTINADEAVAVGAALRAAVLSGDVSMRDVPVTDVCGRRLVTKQNKEETVLFDSDAEITSRKHIFVNDEFSINVYEHLWDHRKENWKKNLIAELSSNTLRVSLPMDIFFLVDINGIFHVDIIKGEIKHGIVSNQNCRETLMNMKNEERRFRRDEDLLKRQVEAMTTLESYCLKQQSLLEDKSKASALTESERLDLIELCEQTLDWLDKNPEASIQEIAEANAVLRVGLGEAEERDGMGPTSTTRLKSEIKSKDDSFSTDDENSTHSASGQAVTLSYGQIPARERLSSSNLSYRVDTSGTAAHKTCRTQANTKPYTRTGSSGRTVSSGNTGPSGNTRSSGRTGPSGNIGSPDNIGPSGRTEPYGNPGLPVSTGVLGNRAAGNPPSTDYNYGVHHYSGDRGASNPGVSTPRPSDYGTGRHTKARAEARRVGQRGAAVEQCASTQKTESKSIIFEAFNTSVSRIKNMFTPAASNSEGS